MVMVKETISEVLKTLNTDPEQGLCAAQARERLEKYGENVFEEAKTDSLAKKVLHHLSEITAIILIIASVIAAYMALTQNDGWHKVVVIMSIVVINTVLGVYQESKAERALEALKKLNTSQTTVIREGKKQKLDAALLVPGDIIELDTGDVITVDARLIESSSLQVDESSLTGESLPVEKKADAVITEDVALGDRLNMVYSGCLVTGGRAVAVVVNTGMESEMGKIAGLLGNTQKLKTPLQLRLSQLAKRLSLLALLAGVVIFSIGAFVYGDSYAEMLLVAISLSVAAVPETLPIIVTMILSHSIHNMVKKKTIIRRIPAVETVGNTSVICTDKTGTLTQNKMEIQQLWHRDLQPVKANAPFGEEEIHLLELLTSCSNATIEIHGDDEKVVGDPTELAIIRLLHDKGFTRVDAERQYPRIHELPFDSTRKLMTTVHHVEDYFLAVTKGAFDKIPVKWDEDLRKRAAETHDMFAEQALRVIAIAYKKYDHLPENLSAHELERDMTLLGLVGMIDPPRPESARAVELSKQAGIKTVMITGDHIVTARAIARQIGIYQDGDKALTNTDLANMSQEELIAAVRDVSVYARVSPEDKINIVKAWNAHGEVVTMTGDGVNDAPALKAADVGAAMGIAGTEVTKSAADMVITDDNFATIVDAISEGRTAYDNIRKVVYFLLSVNFAQIFIMLSGVIMGWGAPLVAVQILLINVICDGVPGFFLSFEKPDKHTMLRGPLPKNASIFAGGMGWKIAQRSLTFSVITISAFYAGAFLDFGLVPSRELGNSMAFLVLALASIINVFNVRSEQSIFKIGFLSNKGVLISALASITITILVAAWHPLAVIFQVVPMSGYHWAIALGLASLQLVTAEVQKALKKGK